MQVLRHKASFNTADAKPANMIAAMESILSRTGATDETKNLIRHQVSSPLMAHKPRDMLSKVERYALKELRAYNDLVIVSADSGRSTVVLDRTDYNQKAKSVLYFAGTIYEQVEGTPMASPISAPMAEAVLQRLESLLCQHHRPKFWARYVDDTFVVIEQDQVLTLKEHLNAVFPDIQFTMEEEENN
ncbi:hypothetical protein SprV_0200923900 [Sparganum proliferum]